MKEELTYFKNLKVKTGYDAILAMLENQKKNRRNNLCFR